MGWGRGGWEGRVGVAKSLSAVYTCLLTGTVSPLQGCLLLLFSSHFFTLGTQVLLQLQALYLGLKQVSVRPDKLLLQLV